MNAGARNRSAVGDLRGLYSYVLLAMLVKCEVPSSCAPRHAPGVLSIINSDCSTPRKYVITRTSRNVTEISMIEPFSNTSI